jgi:hypothetical protein
LNKTQFTKRIIRTLTFPDRGEPIHPSQILYKGDKEEQLRHDYPNLNGGNFFSIDCIRIYELIRALCSFGKELVVLRSDNNIQDAIYQRICELKEMYEASRR